MMNDEAKRDPQAFNKWYENFSHFIKEGIAMDRDNQEGLFRLLRVNSKKNGSKKMVSLDDYVENMQEG